MTPRALAAPVLCVWLAALLVNSDAWGQTPPTDNPHPTTCAPDSDAAGVLERLIHAHERGQVEVLQRLLDERLPGYQALLDAAMRERQTQARTKIHVQNLQAQCAPQAASISFDWEKRALLADNLRPVLISGRTSILLASRLDQGKQRWRVVSISEPNPFWQRSTVPAPVPAMPADPVEPATPADPTPSPGRTPVLNG